MRQFRATLRTMSDDPKTLTPDQMRAEAASLESTAAAYLARAKQLRAVAAAIEALNEGSVSSSLTIDADSTTIQTVNAIGSEGLARGVAKSKSKKHAFVRALYEHPDPSKRMTVTKWAEKHGYKMPTVASWVARGKGARRIPLSAAKKIEKELGVPAALAVWKNGILLDE